ncbi:MAG: hypothetical protein GXW85_08895 [Clostridia bacterium]|nr:hypothetical protein [Clostridia bacterium]
MPKRILFLYNQVTEAERYGPFGDCALAKDVDSIREALQESNNDVISLDLFSPAQLEDFILKNQPIDLAFVIAEGFKSHPQTLYNGHGAALVRKVLSKYNIPYTHSNIEGMENCRNKDITYARLLERGISVPRYLTFETHFYRNIASLEEKVQEIGYPVIIKPAGGGNSIGISQKSVIHDFSHLKERVNELIQELGHATLVIEKYLTGPEYTLGIIGNTVKYILPAIAFPKGWGVRDASRKKMEHKLREKLEIITESHPRFNDLVEIGVETFDAVLANDVLRIDLKEDEEGNIFVIDVNGTPSLSSTSSLSFMASMIGVEHKQLVQMILYESMIKYGLSPNCFFEEFIKGLKVKFVKYESSEVA